MFPPLVLLADSQLLFHRTAEGAPFLARPLALAAGPVLRAAYLGASNGDAPEFYELFSGAMELAGITECRHVKGDAAPDELAFVERADLVLLASGDAERGMRAFERSGARERVVDAYLRGAVLVGVSAGAMQLGALGFGFVPFAIGVHDEPEWSELRRRLGRAGEGARGVGIPAGGGALSHRDGTLEPVRRALTELVVLADGHVVDTPASRAAAPASTASSRASASSSPQEDSTMEAVAAASARAAKGTRIDDLDEGAPPRKA